MWKPDPVERKTQAVALQGGVGICTLDSIISSHNGNDKPDEKAFKASGEKDVLCTEGRLEE